MVDRIREVLNELGYHSIREFPKEFRMRPLYRASDNDTVLSIRKHNGRWIDFKLGIGGNLLDLIELHSVEDVAKWLEEKNFDVDEFSVSSHAPAKLQMPRKFDKNVLLRLSKDTEYWEGRGISAKTLERFGGGVANVGKMANRYVFPIYNCKGEIVGFSGRDLLEYPTKDRMKWKHIGDAGQWVYPAFLNAETIRRSQAVILVESIGDMLALFNTGIENVLCIFGVNLGAGIINFLLKIDAQSICIALNNDTNSLVGNTRALEIEQQLHNYFDSEQVAVCLPEKKDFGVMTPEEISLWNTRRLSQLVA
jgi:hypothetical protein